jgi:hypothetical protein
VFFFEDIFSHFIIVNGDGKYCKNVDETISEKMKKSGKIGEKVNFLKGGCVKASSA